MGGGVDGEWGAGSGCARRAARGGDGDDGGVGAVRQFGGVGDGDAVFAIRVGGGGVGGNGFALVIVDGDGHGRAGGGVAFNGWGGVVGFVVTFCAAVGGAGQRSSGGHGGNHWGCCAATSAARCCCRACSAQCGQQRVEGEHTDRCANVLDFAATQGHIDGLGAVTQVGYQAINIRIFRDVFVEAAVFGLTDQTVVTIGEDVVIVFDDDVRLGTALEQDLQVFADAADFDNVWRKGFAFDLAIGRDLLQLVFAACFGLDAKRLSCRCGIDRNVQKAFVRIFGAGVDCDFELFGHGDDFLNAGMYGRAA